MHCSASGKKYFKSFFLVVFILFFLIEFSFFLKKTYISYKTLAHFHFDYGNLRQDIKGQSIGLRAKELLPANATVSLSPRFKELTKVGLRYQLVPLRTEEDGAFFIAADAQEPVPFSPAGHRPLTWNSVLYAAEGFSFLTTPNKIEALTLPQAMHFTFLWSVVLALTGHLVFRLVHRSSAFRSSLWEWSTCYLLGFLFLTLSLWLFLLLGGALNKTSLILLWSLCFLGLLFFSFRQAPLRKTKSLDRAAPKTSIRSSSKIFLFFSQALALVTVAGIFFILVARPVMDWDGMATWIIKSKVFFYQGRLALAGTRHSYYPILWPLNIAAQFACLNGTFDAVSSWTNGLFFIIFICFIIKGLRVTGMSKGVGLYALLSFYAVSFLHDPIKPYWIVNFTGSNPENILMAYLTATLVFALLWLKNRRETSFLILFLCAGMGLTLSKLEGGVIFLFMLFSLGMSSKGQKKRKPVVYGLGVSLIILSLPVLWFAWVKTQGALSTMVHFESKFSLKKLNILLQHNFIDFFRNNMMILFFLAFGYLAPFYKKISLEATDKFLILVSLLLVFFSSFASIGISIEMIKFGFREIHPRLFQHATPSLLLLWASLFVRINKK